MRLPWARKWQNSGWCSSCGCRSWCDIEFERQARRYQCRRRGSGRLLDAGGADLDGSRRLVVEQTKLVQLLIIQTDVLKAHQFIRAHRVGRQLTVKLPNQRIAHVFGWLPCVLGRIIALPFDEILHAFARVASIDHRLHLIHVVLNGIHMNHAIRWRCRYLLLAAD